VLPPRSPLLLVPALAIAAALALLVSPRAAAEYRGGKVKGAGHVRGGLRLPGEKPTPKQVVPEKDRSVCKPHVDPSLIVGDEGAIANAIVWLDGVTEGKPLAPGNATIDQVGCLYTPRVQALALGSRLSFRNSDATFHNVHAYAEPEGDTAFNLATPQGSRETTRTVDEVGILSFKCDAGHSWMRAWVRVFEHPYFAVTGTDGAFALADVPPGTYTLRAWHETLGELSREIEVKGGATAKVDLAFTRP
jgi:plastocyanin